jgi:hypothetical protein
MSVHDSLIDQLPPAIPDSEFYTTDTIAVPEDANPDSVDDQVYQLSKTPFEAIVSVVATIEGSRSTITGSGFQPVDTTSLDGNDSVEITAGFVDPGTDISVTYRTEPIIVRYLDAYDADIETVGGVYDEVIDAQSVQTASGQQLDLLGSNFGDLGRRATRTDREYAVFLRSLVPSFRATGTKGDIKFAVSSATGIDRENIEIDEFTDEQKFEVVLKSEEVILAPEDLGTIIERTSPAGIELRSNPISRSEVGTLVTISSSVSSQSSSGLNSGTLGDGSLNTSVQTYGSIWY